MERYCKNDKPYIYVAFSEEQEQSVLPVLESISHDGVAFWYEKGWSKKEIKKIQGAFGVLLFVTSDFAKDFRFHTIVDTAVQCGQKILCVYLDKVPSTPWSSMQLGSQQALFTERLDSSFVSILKEAFIFQNMAVTATQKKFQRKRAITLVAAPVLAAAILFFTVINPLLIVPAMATNQLAKQWGLTREDLNSITELHIVGDQAFTSKVHAWYVDNSRSQVAYNQSIDGHDEEQAPISVGTLTTEDLSILQYMPNLECLELEGQQIADISPILDTNVSTLRLNCNPITSISGIEKMDNLKELILSDTDVTDITPAFDLPNLEMLQIDGTKVTNLSGVENLTQLHRLQINETYITQVPTLGELTDFSLDIRVTDISNVAFLKNVKSFNKVFIDLSGDLTIDEVMPYFEGKSIFEMAITGIADITDLYGLNFMEGGHLGIANNYLTSLDGIEYFQGLNSFDCHHNMTGNANANYITDLTALLKIDSLEWVYVSSDMLAMAEEQLQGAHFQIGICDD